MSEQEQRPEQQQPPKRRRLGRGWVAVIVVVSVLAVLVVAAFVTAHFTSRSSFCDSCHEMGPYYASWQTSSHSEAECVDCHIPPGFTAWVKTKLFSFREVWVHITNKVEAPLAVTREIPDSSCYRCHRTPEDVVLGDSQFSHKTHSDQLCITCHVRLVHTDVNPPYYRDPAAMAACLECHDGTISASACADCHAAPHEPLGECDSCHGTLSWTDATFEHPFPTTGGHAGLACVDCHEAKAGAETIPGTDLARPPTACVSCHGDRHGGLTDCSSCHSVAGWKPADFRHPQVGEHYPNGEHRLNCSSCHTSGYGSSSCSCHGQGGGAGEGGDD